MKLDLDINSIKESANIELLAKQMVEGFITGLHKSPYHGFSVEFAEHSLYNYGDSTKNIDWKVYAKTDRLYTKKFEEETNLRCHIVLDTSSSMYYPETTLGKIKFATLASASLSYLLHKQRDAVGLFTFTDRITFQSEVKSTSGHVHNLFTHFQKLFDEKPELQTTGVTQVLHEIADKIPRRSLVIVLSDMFHNQENADEVFSALQHLKHNKHEVLIFHIHDSQTELDFEFDDRPYKFQDLESGEIVKLTPSEVRSQYHGQMKSHLDELTLKCAQLKIDFIPCGIQNGFDTVLSSYLVKRSKMR
ncbi:DUF58 domain-containing protein [Reichenbachiella agarivorans]|uniref:DUF58 domain-containing protein n=1 Tax=Reichenbachiella agarivorans TaxID=2979464 RepID=A0ABY6CJE9_9BACT|nr:DUF58 domain-containing protein [Reichenbachiella agarivorans]UXP30650.1 DUF58 domain-containing protein [Reichenbachiella agarivorans]